MLNKTIAMLIIAGILSSCATPKVVEKRKYTDDHLSCADLKYEMDQAEEFRQRALKEKGVTGTNAAALVLFWPAIFATYNNVNDAVQAAEDRIQHLLTIYRQKNCTKAVQ
jgi:hypothetical protein